MKIGFFGKLPSYGDFVQRNTNPAIIDYWDNWLSHCIGVSQRSLGDAWKETFFNSPLWRFHIQGGEVVADAISGVMMPSVDAAGRCYPFVVVCQFSPDTNVFTLASKIDSLHANCEEMCIGLLEQQQPNLDQIVQLLQTNYAALERQFSADAVHHIDTCEPELYRSVEQDSLSCSEVHEAFFARVIEQQGRAISIWHTTQNLQVKKQYRYYQGMPPAAAFASLLRGE